MVGVQYILHSPPQKSAAQQAVPRQGNTKKKYVVADSITRPRRVLQGCSAYLDLACLGLFSLTEYYSFYQSYTIHAVRAPTVNAD